MRKALVYYFGILFFNVAQSQTLMYQYLNKKVEKYSVPYSLNINGKNNTVLDSFGVRYYSKLLSILKEEELYSNYKGMDIIRLVVNSAWQKSMLIKIIHINNYDSLLLITKTFDFSNHITKEFFIKYPKGEHPPHYTYRYDLKISKISLSHWDRLLTNTNKANFWYSKQPKDIPVPDGEMVLLEEHFKNGYFIIDHFYDDRESNSLKELIYFILKLIK